MQDSQLTNSGKQPADVEPCLPKVETEKQFVLEETRKAMWGRTATPSPVGPVGPGLQGERWSFLSPLDALRSDPECTVLRNLEHGTALNDFQRQHGAGHLGGSCDCGPRTDAGLESRCSKDDMLHCQGWKEFCALY